MDDEKLFKGFNQDFLVDDTIKQKVPFPSLHKKKRDELAPVKYNNKLKIDYLNFSVQLSGSRKFPIFTASNIDGNLFKAAPRPKSWRLDNRVRQYQWGKDLYEAKKSDFDKGHMTKREDVQWGDTPGLAQKAADSTFFYTNAVPQHADLNQQIWKKLEDYILHTETRKRSLKVCVFTGPVLGRNDPPFVTAVEGETVLLPTLFWKIVVYPKEDGKLYRVGFLMSQKKLLIKNGIIKPSVKPSAIPTAIEKVFNEFDDAGTYQVNISLIETLTDLKMPKAIDAYKDDRSKKLIMKRIEVSPKPRASSTKVSLGFSISNIVL